MNIHGWYIVIFAVIIAGCIGGVAWWMRMASRKKGYKEE